MNFLIDSVDIYLPIFTDNINSVVRNGTFQEELKLAEVTPPLEKARRSNKSNCRLISLLSRVLKACERIFFQSNQYIF